MIFRDSLAQLQANNLCRHEKPYAQPVVTASDINLQGRLPMQIQDAYYAEIKLFNCDGTIEVADITDQCRILFATSIYNFRYFNVQLREWGEDWPLDCFTIRVLIQNNGQIIFNKTTETYKRLQSDKQCYIELTERDWNDFTLGIYQIRINQDDDLTFESPNDLPNHFELIYQPGTRMYHLFFDCDQVNVIEFVKPEANALAFPLAGALGGGLQTKIFPIYAIYIVDESGCRLPYTRLESTYECLDNITGLYYGDPKQLLNFPDNDSELKYTNSQWIESELKKQPTEYTKEVSYFGRTQRVDYVEQFKYIGLIPFPEWKFREIEALFAGKRIFIDSNEYIFPKGTLFKKDTIRCTCNWLLETTVESQVVVNEFSCIEQCKTLCYYFTIFGGTKDQAYYDENGILIGHLFQDLLDYFNNLPDVISVEDFNIENLNCTPVAVIKIDTYGTVPSYIHYWELSPSNRIYAKRDDCTNPDNLCDGWEGICPVPQNITSNCISLIQTFNTNV